MRQAHGDDERREHPMEDDRDRMVPEEDGARDHGDQVPVAEPEPLPGEKPLRIEEEAALPGEVEADLRHHADEEDLGRQQIRIGHQARVPGLHRRKERHIEEGNERLAQYPQDKEPEKSPQKKAMEDSFYFFSYILS